MRCLNPPVGLTCLLLVYLFTTVNTLAIIPQPQTLSNAFASTPLVNATALDANVDSRFSLRAMYNENSLPVTPCLMNVVELMAYYAELDWLSKVTYRHGSVLPSYPEVEIAVFPAAPATSVEIRLVLWGLWIGTRDLMQTGKFREVEFEVLWERQVKAHIYFTKPFDIHVTSSNGTSDTNEPLTLLPSPNETAGGILDTSNSTENSPDALSDGRFVWKPFFTPTAKTLTVFEVFLTVMVGLKNAASHPADGKIGSPFASAASDVFANVQFSLHKRRTPRTNPPFFQYIHVIKSLRLVPRYMLEKKKFAELFFAIEVGGIMVGEGYLEKGHYIPPSFVLGDVLASKDNVSLS